MHSIHFLAETDGLVSSYIHTKAVDLFSFLCKANSSFDTEYTAKICYWLCSNLEPDYVGECAYDLIPACNSNLSLVENKIISDRAIDKVIDHVIDILLQCGGNLINPQINTSLLRKDGLNLKEHPVIGEGSYGKVYLVDGLAVKVSHYSQLCREIISLLKETTVLAMLHRLKFIGVADGCYYVGMEYYPHNLVIDQPLKIMKELSQELANLHSLGIIHRDIKWTNIRMDSNGTARIIDFGCCRFTPAINSYIDFGTYAYRDYLILGKEIADYSYEIDIWALGIVFYIIQTNSTPWPVSSEVDNYAPSVKEHWESAMRDANELVRGMLSLSKDSRWSIEQIISYFT